VRHESENTERFKEMWGKKQIIDTKRKITQKERRWRVRGLLQNLYPM
jgi:hypothetical protein